MTTAPPLNGLILTLIIVPSVNHLSPTPNITRDIETAHYQKTNRLFGKSAGCKNLTLLDYWNTRYGRVMVET